VAGTLAHAEPPLRTSLIEGINEKIKVIVRMAYGFGDEECLLFKIRLSRFQNWSSCSLGSQITGVHLANFYAAKGEDAGVHRTGIDWVNRRDGYIAVETNA
jgi:hypothetical protein